MVTEDVEPAEVIRRVEEVVGKRQSQRVGDGEDDRTAGSVGERGGRHALTPDREHAGREVLYVEGAPGPKSLGNCDGIAARSGAGLQHSRRWLDLHEVDYLRSDRLLVLVEALEEPVQYVVVGLGGRLVVLLFPLFLGREGFELG